MKISPKHIHIANNIDLNIDLNDFDIPQFQFIVPVPEKKEQITVYTGKKDKSKSLF